MSEKIIDSYALKLSGKAELPEPLEIGHNFRVQLEGSITEETIIDNDDGSKTHLYKFKPVLVEAITPQGKTIKARDTRSRSQQLRAVLFRKWRELNEPVTFDEFYDRIMLEIISKQINFETKQ